MWQKVKNIYHLFMAILANIWYAMPAGRQGFPSRKLTIIGVTGTDGKTTTVGLIYHILHTAGMGVSMISTVGAIIHGKTYDVGFHVTTPSSWKLQQFIKRAKEGGPPRKFLVLEVTSHAIDQYRVWGVDFAVGVLTNITHEHLDYHKTYENYVTTKARLLKRAKVVVVNRDDDSYRFLSSKLKAQNSKLQGKIQKLITFGMGKNIDVNPHTFPFKTKLIGEFNQYNCLAAIAVCRELSVADETIRKAVASYTLPIGRMEIVHEDEFTVMIDFAHTPNSFEKILPEIKRMTAGRLIHVFGSAGKRDGTKRSPMGSISAKYADVIILTAEDPRGEDINVINRQIMEGIEKAAHKPETYSIVDRKEAIIFAVGLAKKGDMILLTGKSHEQSMNYTGKEESWSEYEAVEEALKNG